MCGVWVSEWVTAVWVHTVCGFVSCVGVSVGVGLSMCVVVGVSMGLGVSMCVRHCVCVCVCLSV